MELHDAFVVERYRDLLERDRVLSTQGRDALAWFGRMVTLVGLGAVTLVAAREPMSIDRPDMPVALQGLGVILAMLALVALIQLAVALLRRNRCRRIQRALDPSGPPTAWWWVADAAYAVIVLAITVVGEHFIFALAGSYS